MSNDGTVDGSTATSRTSGTASTASTTKAPGTLDKDAFLKLLVAQLKYQNPLSPTDPSQMMAQTSQFTMVETLQHISQAQSDAGAWQRVVAGQGMIGRQVTGSVQDSTVTGVVTGMTITADGPVLQLDGGRTLPVGAVLGVTSAPAGPAAPSAP